MADTQTLIGNDGEVIAVREIFGARGPFPEVIIPGAEPAVGTLREGLLVESFAHMAGKRTSEPKPEGNVRFGLKHCVEALRALADMLEAGRAYPQDVLEATRAMNDDYCMTALTVVYAKRIKE